MFKWLFKKNNKIVKNDDIEKYEVVGKSLDGKWYKLCGSRLAKEISNTKNKYELSPSDKQYINHIFEKYSNDKTYSEIRILGFKYDYDFFNFGYWDAAVLIRSSLIKETERV